MITSLQAAIEWEQKNQLEELPIFSGHPPADSPDEVVPPWEGDNISWDELTALEPKLKTMLTIILALAPNPSESWCANKVWYDVFKPRMKNLVGWTCFRKNPALRSSQAYDVAYEKLYGLLPACRDCGCV